jgi:hypothetical protein
MDDYPTKHRIHRGLYSGAMYFIPSIGPCEFYLYDPSISRWEFFNIYGGMEYLSDTFVNQLPKPLKEYKVEEDSDMDWRPVRAHYYMEKQRTARRVERAGWVGFAIGSLVTALVFVFWILPVANS